MTAVCIADVEAAAGGKHPVFCDRAAAGAADRGGIAGAVDRDGDGFTVAEINRLDGEAVCEGASSYQRLDRGVVVVKEV